MNSPNSVEDGTSSILAYKLRLHGELRKRKTMGSERRLRLRYESARRCLQMLGKDPSVLPELQMSHVLLRMGRTLHDLRLMEMEKRSGSAKSVLEETRRVYGEICKKSIAKVHKMMLSVQSVRAAIHKKISTVCQREARRALTKTAKTNPQLKGKRITRELALFYRRSERSTREEKRRAEKEDYERRKKEEEVRESERQAKKLDFLITQTELFSYFILGKKGAASKAATDESRSAMEATREAAEKQRKQAMEFDSSLGAKRGGKGEPAASEAVYNNSVLPISPTIKVPSILNCSLKDYQKRGLEWLVSLYDQGINGMLADEMGLGKTVQAISFLAYLAESENTWGPFLIITPASTLHNWEQEFAKFLPSFRVISYWGSIQDRKALRKDWQQRKLRRKDSPFHGVITSYQLAVTDEKYFNRLKWQYMILDEAQAIKSSSSARWKSLLEFKSRNRLLLTGTPIQNTLHELWALLHFIMPMLFDSHGEFNEWFKIEDGENRTEAARLRMVLQPFMLRREKKDVADELGEKVEKTIFCSLSPKQKRLYEGIRTRAPMASLLDKISFEDIEGVEGLMNLVMQLRKVCNHPDLFERREAITGWVDRSIGVYVPGIVAREFLHTKRAAPGPFETDSARVCREWKRLVLEAVAPSRFGVGASAGEKVAVGRGIPGQKAQELARVVIPHCITRRLVLSTSDREIAPSLSPADLAVLGPEHRSEPDCAIGRSFPGLRALSARDEFVHLPSMERFVSDSGKLAVLDELLPQLKAGGHRVLIYFQMTRMIDLFEDYLTVRKYSYLRLDGSSRISNRKEIVRDWQSSSDKFIFLLSTRAGGLGINLTAADTVIFYDSDWNPTADQQAMDRAHRLGQTKQVTVYRLVTAGTIEERVMERAGIKGEMQRMVIQTHSP